MFSRIAYHTEHFLKGLAFGCHGCGQCVLRKTALICPMRCPKGLRNGPCGGTLEGRCEVYPERRCIWVRIDTARHGARLAQPPTLPAPDHALFHTPSVQNLVNGRDRAAREPLPVLCQDPAAAARPVQTRSRLEAALKSGRFVFTTEVRTPRSPVLTRLVKEATALAPDFDAVNATAFLCGHPSLPSSVAAGELQRQGVEAIAQATGRDHTRTTFIGELMAGHLGGVRNVLCLTGDYYVGEKRVKQVFDLDSSLMLYEARYLREQARIHFTGEEVADRPQPFLGCAINPMTDPIEVPVRRLLQKAACGAEFVQTQVVTDVGRLARFMELYRRVGLDRRLFLIAGIPVVIGKKALAALPRVPGVSMAPALKARLEGAADLRVEGVRAAAEMVAAAAAIPGVSGAHLMLFGADHHALAEVRQMCAGLRPAAIPEPAVA